MWTSLASFMKSKIQFKSNDPSEDLSVIGDTLREVIDWGYTDGLRGLQDVPGDAIQSKDSAGVSNGAKSEDAEPERARASKPPLSLPKAVQILANEYKLVYRRYQSLHKQKGKVDEDLRRTRSLLRMTENRVTEVERTHSSEMDVKLREFNSRLEDSRLKHEQARMLMEEEHQRQVDDLLGEAEQNEATLKHNHQQEIARLNKIIHGRTKAIVTRETFTPTTDRDLKTKFTELSSKVDSLAKLQWSPERSTWRDDQLKQVRISSKKLQKSIIQETVWLVLHEYILCSPFRVFGTEGIIMEKQWNDAYGNEGFRQKHFCWPAASFDSEKWRYETIRPGQEALKVQTSEYDPRTKLLIAYQENVQLVQKSIAEKLSLVADLDEKAMQTIKTIATNVSEAWVLFGTQRCRVFFVFEDLKVTVEPRESDASSGRSVEFLVKPDLRRIGDADGESLDKELLVPVCNGEIRMFEY